MIHLRSRTLKILCGAALLVLFTPASALARQGSFVAPGTGAAGGPVTQALNPDPAETDIGESQIGVAKRATLFFANTSNTPIDFVKFEVASDGNVAAEIAANDCEKLKSLPARERCSVTLAVTPISGGAWTAQVLVQHNGPGRVTRAEVYGTTLGGAADAAGAGERTGLSVSENDFEAVDFGSIEAGYDRAVRTVLLVNDSSELLRVLDIEVIAADNGLARLNQGCKEQGELKPGESCPITIVWQPEARGSVSTDLIVRHTGRQGFMVVPVRGTASGDDSDGPPRRTRLKTDDSGALLNAASGRGERDSEDADTATQLAAPALPSGGLTGSAGAATAGENLPSRDALAALSPGDLFADEDEDRADSRSGGGKRAVDLAEMQLKGIIGERVILQLNDDVVTIGPNEEMQIGEARITLLGIKRRTAQLKSGDIEFELSMNNKPVFNIRAAEEAGEERAAEQSAAAESAPPKSKKKAAAPDAGSDTSQDTARGMASAPPAISPLERAKELAAEAARQGGGMDAPAPPLTDGAP